jgi:hypothetical protein
MVTLIKSQVEVHWQDPPSSGNDIDLDLSVNEFMIDYYSLIFKFLVSSEALLTKDYYTAKVGSLPLVVGLHREIYESMQNSKVIIQNFAEQGRYAGDLSNTYVGKDGILVQVMEGLGWF